jgi:PEP-CTERM motif
LAFADPINPIDTPAGKAGSDPRPDIERMWNADPTSPAKEGEFSSNHAPITFADIGFPGEPKEDQDHDHDDFPKKKHHHLVVPEPSTFLLLGVALIYCAKLLRRQLSRV